MTRPNIGELAANNRATIKVVTVMALWAGCFPLITTGLTLAPHITFAAMRALIAGGALVGTALVLRRPVPKGRTTWLLLSASGVGATTLGFLGMFHAAEFIAPGMATVIANTQPLLAAALAYLVLNERLGDSAPRASHWVSLASLSSQHRASLANRTTTTTSSGSPTCCWQRQGSRSATSF